MIWSENRSFWNPRRQKPDRREKHKGCQSLPAGYCSGFGAAGPPAYPSVARQEGRSRMAARICDATDRMWRIHALLVFFSTGDKPREIG